MAAQAFEEIQYVRLKRPGQAEADGSLHHIQACKAYHEFIMTNDLDLTKHSMVYIAVPHARGGTFEALFRPRGGPMSDQFYYDEVQRNARGDVMIGLRNIEASYRIRRDAFGAPLAEPAFLVIHPFGPLGNPLSIQPGSKSYSGSRRRSRRRSRSRRSRYSRRY
jgi:hypothetical protein